ncbi:hypothetical protein [Denitrificimonas caeni]|uniref:hypothetical protein n=1 Tax=Denitrificimonas caeni TaxID=521720 RepID=UPI001962D604|nr:hypothetical protein [Denitrificimonas caeni]
MFKFLLGAITGLFSSMMIFSTLTVFDVNIDMSVITNIIIAAATVIATAIHFDSQRKQRIDRIWDINKSILLDLTYSLSEAMEATEIEIQNRYSYDDEQVATKHHVWSELNEKINYMLNVYGSLVSSELLSSINHHKQVSRKISSQVNYEYLDTTTAYEEMLIEHKALYGKLLSFIAKISGVSAI